MTGQELEPIVYRELRAIATAAFRNERPNHTLQPTALVNEAWLRLVNLLPGKDADADSRRHFLAIATNVMRQVLVEHARGRATHKRGGDMHRVSIAGEFPMAEANSSLLIDLDAALTQLAQRDERVARIAELRIFGGLQITEIAEQLDISATTVKTDWALARAVLQKVME